MTSLVYALHLNGALSFSLHRPGLGVASPVVAPLAPPPLVGGPLLPRPPSAGARVGGRGPLVGCPLGPPSRCTCSMGGQTAPSPRVATPPPLPPPGGVKGTPSAASRGSGDPSPSPSSHSAPAADTTGTGDVPRPHTGTRTRTDSSGLKEGGFCTRRTLLIDFFCLFFYVQVVKRVMLGIEGSKLLPGVVLAFDVFWLRPLFLFLLIPLFFCNIQNFDCCRRARKKL